MTFEEYRSYDALGLAELVRKKAVKAEELLEIAINRIEAVNPDINAVIQPLYDLARKMIAKIPEDAPFSGVPLLVKDLELEIAGTPMRSGSRAYQDYQSTEDSFIIDRLRKAGMVFLAKTNTPEFGITPYTEPATFGPTRNPWDTDRNPGGSSGGSAAAVAAGISPIATATDGGGSIRIPAANCGLFGMKPSRGRTSLGKHFGEAWAGAVSTNCVSRSVRDSAAFLDLIKGPASGDPYWLPDPKISYSQSINADPEKLKIGYSTQHPLNKPVHEEVVEAVTEAARLAESLGHEVAEVPLPFEKEELSQTFLTMIAGEVAATVEETGYFLGRKPRPSDVEPSTYALYLLGNSFTAKEYALQKRKWNTLARKMGRFHQQYDLLLCPTLSLPPTLVGELQPTPAEKRLINLVNTFRLKSLVMANLEQLADKIFTYVCYTPFANMTGQPAMSVPLFWTKDQLPVGVMFTAATGREDLLFQLAGQLERAKPWFDKVP